MSSPVVMSLPVVMSSHSRDVSARGCELYFVYGNLTKCNSLAPGCRMQVRPDDGLKAGEFSLRIDGLLNFLRGL